MGIDESEAVQRAIDNSLNTIPLTESDDAAKAVDEIPPNSSDDFQVKIKQLADAKVHGPHRTIVVSRLSIWPTAFPYFQRNGFLKGSGLLQVTFATFESEEDAVDLGGPRREFFHLLLGAIARESGTVISKIYPECFYFNFNDENHSLNDENNNDKYMTYIKGGCFI